MHVNAKKKATVEIHLNPSNGRHGVLFDLGRFTVLRRVTRYVLEQWRTMEDCISIEVGLRRRGEGEQRYYFQRETRFLNSQFIMIWDLKNLSINKAVC